MFNHNMTTNTNTTDNIMQATLEFDAEQASREISKEKLSLDMSGIDPSPSKIQTHRSKEADPIKEMSHFGGSLQSASLYSATNEAQPPTTQQQLRLKLKFNQPP